MYEMAKDLAFVFQTVKLSPMLISVLRFLQKMSVSLSLPEIAYAYTKMLEKWKNFILKTLYSTFVTYLDKRENLQM